MLDVINPSDHGHDHVEEEEGDEDAEEGADDEDDGEGETEEEYQQRLAEAKEKLKKNRDEGFEKQQKGVFKHLFRSKGFLWLSNRPNLFFEWSQAAVNNNICVGGPWVCTLSGKSLALQAQDEDIGDRQINLIFIGQNMKQQKDLIIEELDRCVVTDDEWKEILGNKLVQNVENDPFKEAIPEDEEEDENKE
jgi:G3E family GTPase